MSDLNQTPTNEWLNWNLSYSGDSYHPLYGGGSVEEATRRTLQQYLPLYIAEINSQFGSDPLSVPSTYHFDPRSRVMATRGVDAQLLVQAPQTVEVYRMGIGQTRATFLLRVTVFLWGTMDFAETEAITQAYVSAIVGCLSQVGKTLQGLAESTLLQSTRVGDPSLNEGNTRYRCSGMATFHVVIPNIVDTRGGVPPYGSVDDIELEVINLTVSAGGENAELSTGELGDNQLG